jgi:DNA-binding MarR family transcriptional regulator
MGEAKASQKKVSQLESHLGFWLRFVSNHVSYAFASKLLESGVTVAEWVVLRHLYDADETSPSALADAAGMTRGAASKLVERLLVKRLLTRQGRSDDRRFQTIALTAAGRQLVPKLAAIADRNDREFFAALSAKERAAMTEMLKRLVEANVMRTLPTE